MSTFLFVVICKEETTAMVSTKGTTKAGRVIGIVHRRKKTKDEEKRPTQVAILSGGKVVKYSLETETDELDFLLCRFPISYQEVTDRQSDLSHLQRHHITWRKVGPTERIEDYHESHIRQVGKVHEIAGKIPKEYEGLASGDAVAMPLGGSGDRFAAALSRRGEEIGARVFRIPPMMLKTLRGSADKDENCSILARELSCKFAGANADMRPFYQLRARDRSLIRVKEAFTLREQAMKNRIAVSAQIEQAAIGRIFLNEEGRYPEGEIEEQLRELRASDVILQGMQDEEDRRMKELEQAVYLVPIWPLFKSIKGVGVATGARLIAAIGDIRRFWVDPDPVRMEESYAESRRLEKLGKLDEDLDKVASRVNSSTTQFQVLQMVRSWKQAHGKQQEALYLTQAIAEHKKRSKLRREAMERGKYKLRAFCGVHVLQGGKYADVSPEKSFPRRRSGQVCNWHPWARQALYLLGEQFNRRPDSEWGKKLRHYKALRKQAHPEVVEENGKRRHTNAHIHQAGIWKTLSHFVDMIFLEWTRLEKQLVKDEETKAAA